MKKTLILAAIASAAVSHSQTNTNITATVTMPEATPPPATVNVVIDTTHGVIRAELNAEKAPITVANFLEYVDAGYYNGTIFHRVMKDFMIQGGGFTPDMRQKPTRAQIKNEATNGLKNERGTLAMARTAIVDSATSQFFINHADNGFLNHTNPSTQGYGYCVFGKVTEGLDVVDKIAAVAVVQQHHTGHGNVPVDPVKIISITRAVK